LLDSNVVSSQIVLLGGTIREKSDEKRSYYATKPAFFANNFLERLPWA